MRDLRTRLWDGSSRLEIREFLSAKQALGTSFLQAKALAGKRTPKGALTFKKSAQSVRQKEADCLVNRLHGNVILLSEKTMKLQVKSIGMFVCGAAIASLPYTLSLGKANAQGTVTSSSHSSTNSSANSSGSKSAETSSTGSQNAFGSKSAGANISGGQNSSNSGSGSGNSGSSSGSGSGSGSTIGALTNDEVYLYIGSGDTLYTMRKSDHQIVSQQHFPPSAAQGRSARP